jgi:hypothetical protein
MKETQAKLFVKQLQNGTSGKYDQEVYDLILNSNDYTYDSIFYALDYTAKHLRKMLKRFKKAGVLYITNKDVQFDETRYGIETSPTAIEANRKKIHADKVQKWIDKGVKLGIDFEIKGL